MRNEDLQANIPTVATIQSTLSQYTESVNQTIIALWQNTGLSQVPDLSLYATGGYARDELFLYSDVDILILFPAPINDEIAAQISQFLTAVWDAKIKISHFVGDYTALQQLIQEDLDRYTNLLELRLIAGTAIPQDIYQQWIAQIDPQTFYQRKLAESSARHKNYGETSYALEPNVKQSPGGLRDIHVLHWQLKRYQLELDSPLQLYDLLNQDEAQELKTHYAYLCWIRWLLHTIANRAEDRLLFEYQKGLAEFLEIPGNSINERVEKLMNEYYLAIKKNNEILDILTQEIQQKISPPTANAPTLAPLSDLLKNPELILNFFQELMHNELSSNDIRTLRQLREHFAKITDNPNFRKSFLHFIKNTTPLEPALHLMHRYGLLGSYISDFQRLTGRMQYDLFHVYTVDKHLLMVIRILDSFEQPAASTEYPLCHQLFQQIPNKLIIRLAALFHDIGKGLGGDHSQLGKKISVKFNELHALEPSDSDLIAWLVQQHLLMSITAQKKDIYASDVIEAFAQEVASIERLNYLYLLTVADIVATDSKLWNSWKASLLQQLYQSTVRCLENNSDHPTESLIASSQQQALAYLPAQISIETAQKLWQDWPHKYFLRHAPKTIALHTEKILSNPDQQHPVVVITHLSGHKTYEIFIYMQDKSLIVCNTTHIFDKLHFNILEAQILTSQTGYTLDTFVISDLNEINQKLSDSKLAITLQQELGKSLKIPVTRKRATSRRQKQFAMTPTIEFITDTANKRTVMSLVALDMPGLLATVTACFAKQGIQIQHAKIATMGERAEDTFYITQEDGQPLLANIQEQLHQMLLQNLSGTAA